MDIKNLPPGWDDNPSQIAKRLPTVVLAILGCGIASYLTLCQLGVFKTVWEPFFGNGSEQILHSSLASSLPVPDALLGALAYLAEGLLAGWGGEDRWHTKPWLVAGYTITASLLGFGSMLLVIFQPVLFNTWCSLCLASAAISLFVWGSPFEEFLASLQYLKRLHQQGYSRWRTFWGLADKTGYTNKPHQTGTS